MPTLEANITDFWRFYSSYLLYPLAVNNYCNFKQSFQTLFYVRNAWYEPISPIVFVYLFYSHLSVEFVSDMRCQCSINFLTTFSLKFTNVDF